MLTRGQRLTSFIAEGAGLPFVWGERDCCTWAAEWARRETGRDPSAAVRARYRTRLGCARYLKRSGGMVAAVAGLVGGVGLSETAEPALGDIGLVETAVGVMGAISTGFAWAIKTEDGIVIVPAPVIKAWSV
jgi:hypothetical protein